MVRKPWLALRRTHGQAPLCSLLSPGLLPQAHRRRQWQHRQRRIVLLSRRCSLEACTLPCNSCSICTHRTLLQSLCSRLLTWLCSRYSDSDFTTPAAVLMTSKIDFSKSSSPYVETGLCLSMKMVEVMSTSITLIYSAPDSATLQDFAIRWSGFFKPSADGSHTFSVALSTADTTDEWFLMSIDAAAVVSRDPSFGSVSSTGAFHLSSQPCFLSVIFVTCFFSHWHNLAAG